MWSLTSAHMKCIGGPRKFRRHPNSPSPKKDFFNTIGTFQTCRRRLPMPCFEGKGGHATIYATSGELASFAKTNVANIRRVAIYRLMTLPEGVKPYRIDWL